MSERFPESKQEANHETRVDRPEAAPVAPAESRPSRSRHEKAEQLQKIHEQIQHEAAPASEVAKKDTENAPYHPVHITRQLKAQSFARTMKSVQQHLSKPEAAFSKVIHNDLVDKTSEIASQTVGRPSALIGGGVFALVGLVAITWLAKHNGFQLSGYEFLILLMIGMLLGVSLEFIQRFFAKLIKK